MAANNSNNKDNKSDFNINRIKNICSKYKKYIATGAMLILLAVVVSTSQKASGGNEPLQPDTKVKDTTTDDTTADTEEFEVNAYPQINGLFEEYYECYAKGDTTSIEKIAFPISDTEKSYIECFSKSIDSYEDINCYSKKGISDGEYIVTVVVQMKFKDVKTTAPNMDTFYVRRDEKGNCYIDNAYSSFNQTRYKENLTDEKINELITQFGEGEDVIAMHKEVRDEYDKALEKDEKLKEMIASEIPDVLADWVAGFSPETTVDGESDPEKDKADDSKNDSKEDTKTDDGNDTAQGDTNPDDTQSDDTEPDETDEPDQSETKPDDNDTSGKQTRTAYAKTKVNLREKRSTDSEILKTLSAGTKVTIYGTSKDGWFQVKAKGLTGYVSKEYIVSDPSKVQVQKRTAYAKTKVNMRKKKSTDSDVVQTLKAGTKVMLYGKSEDGWFKVRSKGKFGYVKKEYIVSSKSKVEKDNTSNTSGSGSVKYYNEGDTITLTESVNIRTSMSETADRVGLAYQGDVVTIIMSYAEGWSKVSWNGQTGYAKTEFIK